MVDKVKMKDVIHAYFGEAGKCCCGCSGDHVYYSKNIGLVKREDYTPDIDDGYVRAIVKDINARIEMAEEYPDLDGGTIVSVDDGPDRYIVYLRAKE